jgi:hypothetical protein
MSGAVAVGTVRHLSAIRDAAELCFKEAAAAQLSPVIPPCCLCRQNTLGELAVSFVSSTHAFPVRPASIIHIYVIYKYVFVKRKRKKT